MAKRLSRSKRVGRGGGGGANMAARQSRPATVVASPEELAAQYSYVLRDLARIGIIAFILIGGLVALSFIPLSFIPR